MRSWTIGFGFAVSLLVLALAGPRAAWAVTMGPQSAAYSPGSVSHVPIVVDLGAQTADRFAFSVQVVPGPGAPALTANLGFEAVDVAAPTYVDPTTTQISVAWFMAVTPPRTGPVTLGNVLVPIPTGASMSNTYTVHMMSGGASLGGDELTPMTYGPDIILGAPAGPPVITITITLAQIGVDVSPTNWALGIVSIGQSRSSWTSGSPGSFVASNTGNVAEDFTISAGRTDPSDWTPGPAPGANTFAICFGLGADPYTSEPSWACFGELPVAMEGPVSVGTDLHFDLRFTAPTSGTTGGENESFVISLAAAASE